MSPRTSVRVWRSGGAPPARAPGLVQKTTDAGSFTSYQVSEVGATPVRARVSPTDPIRAEVDALFDVSRPRCRGSARPSATSSTPGTAGASTTPSWTTCSWTAPPSATTSAPQPSPCLRHGASTPTASRSDHSVDPTTTSAEESRPHRASMNSARQDRQGVDGRAAEPSGGSALRHPATSAPRKVVAVRVTKLPRLLDRSDRNGVPGPAAPARHATHAVIRRPQNGCGQPPPIGWSLSECGGS